VVLAAVLSLVVPSQLVAQVRIQIPPFARLPSIDGRSRMVHVTDRRLVQRLLKARDLMTQNQVQPAIRLLQSLIDHKEDVFFRELSSDGSGLPTSPFLSLKLAASRLLGSLGQRGRSGYELEYGTIARGMYERAREAGGSEWPERLEEIARRYLHCRAGRQAAYALGNRRLDQGQTLMAAMRYEQLKRLGAEEFEPLLSIRTALAWARLGQTARAARILLAMSASDRRKVITRGGPLGRALANPSQDAVVGALSELMQDPDHSSAGGSPGGSWVLWRGRHDRLGQADPAVPGARPQWSFSTFHRELDDPKRQDRLDEVRGELGDLEASERARDDLLLPAVDPLVIGNVVVFRSLFDIKAVDLSTGRHLWDSITVDPAFERVLEGKVPSYSVAGRSTRQSLTRLFLGQRAWHDRTIGSLSSDGRHVYAVDWVGVLGLQVFTGQAFGGRGTGSQPDLAAPWVPRAHNRLLAFDLASQGMLLWELGGPRGDGEHEVDGTFFLGPPLPLGGRLYCLGERDGEIRLLAIRPDAGHHAAGRGAGPPDGQDGGAIEWSQGIAQPEYNVLTHPGRRLAGLSPSYSDGVLVCPTEAGLIVGIDVARRTLLWSYSYLTTNHQRGPNAQQAMRRVLMSNRIARLPQNSGWFDPVPLLAAGSVILTPRDSDQLHCLDLETGRLRWSRSRGQARFVATVHQDTVVVVERSRVQAYRLADGQPAWSMPTAIPRPSGVGVRIGGLYHLPVEARDAGGGSATGGVRRGAIVTIDLATGRLLARTELAEGRLVGHLVGAGGRLLGLSHDELVGFETDHALEQRIASRLDIDKHDATALALRGRRRLHRGEYEPAVADLAAAFEAKPDPEVRRLLVQALLDGLRFDYSRYASQATKLESLLVEPDEQLAFRRLRATGLARTGNVIAAFREYLKLRHSAKTQQPPPQPPPQKPPQKPPSPAKAERGRLEAIDEDLSVRRIDWVASRLKSVDRLATDEQRRELDSVREQLLARAVVLEGAAGTRALSGVVTLLDGHRVADLARIQLLGRLSEKTGAMEREMLLSRLRRSADPVVAGRATVELSVMWAAAKKTEAMTVLRDELETGRFSRVELSDGRSGRQTVAGWRSDPARKELIATPPAWKPGRVSVVSSVNEERRTSVNTYPIPFHGRRPLAWRGWSFRLDNRRQYVIAFDERGRERWRLTTVGDLAVPDSEARVPYAFEGNQIQASGHLLMIVLGNRFAVIDGLGNAQHPDVLWRRNLYEDKSGVQARIIRLPGAMAAGPRWFRMTDATGRPLGHVGRLGPRRLIYQVGAAIEAADPVSGQVIWRRTGVSRGCRIYGSDRFVCVEADGRQEVLVLDAADGASIATRTLPDSDDWIGRSGHHVVSRQTTNGVQVVSVFDLVTGKTTRQWKLSGDLRPVLVGQRAVGLLEPPGGQGESIGRFRVIDVADGRVRVDCRLSMEPAQPLRSFFVLNTLGQHLLVVNQPSSVSVRGASSQAIAVHGSVWAFDRRHAAGGSEDTLVSTANWGPVRIEHQTIEQDQPMHLPVLAFVSRVYRPVQNILQKRPRTEYGALVLDVRKGKIVHKETSTLPVSAMRAVSSRTDQRVTLEFYRSTITVDFGD